MFPFPVYPYIIVLCKKLNNIKSVKISSYLSTLASVSLGIGIVQALSVTVATIDYVATDHARLAMKSIPAESRAADADVSTAGFV